jgi:hypothetical protein
MKRLYFVLPDKESCKNVVAQLRDAGIPNKRLHVVARLAVPLDDLPEASLTQRTELVHGLERGIALGGTAGLLGGMLVLAFPPAGLLVGGGGGVGGGSDRGRRGFRCTRRGSYF